MKQLKRLLVMLLCLGAMLSVTACGSSNDAKDNVSKENSVMDDEKNNLDTKDTNDVTDGMEDGDTNDVTDGKDTGNAEGTVDEIGDDLKEGAEDIGDSMKGNNDRDNSVNDTNKQ